MKFPDFLRIKIDSKRVYGLDILRAAAILFVVFGHGKLLLNDNIQAIHKYFIFDGVAIFFVLSGFLIGGILIKHLEKGAVSLKTLFSFWCKRWLRTLPAYYFALFLLVVARLRIDGNFSLWDIKRYFVFLQNFSYPHPDFFPEAWSLSIEEWFYLLIPLILFLLIRFFRFSVARAVVTAAVLIIVFTTAFRFFRYSQTPVVSWDFMFRKQVVTQLDSLMFGVLGAYWAYYRKNSWIKVKSVLFVLGLFILSTQHILNFINLPGMELYQCVFSFTTTSTGVLCLLPYFSELKGGSGFIYKAITYIAVISYSMYLLHFSFIQNSFLKTLNFSLLVRLHLTSFVIYPLYWALTLIGSILMYKCIEKPFMDMRSKS